MSRPRAGILVLLFVAGSGLCLTVGARRLMIARDQRQMANVALQQSIREAGEMTDLRARRQTVEMRQRPRQDVIAQVNAAMAEVGIPERNLKNLTPEAEGALNGERASLRLKQQSVRLVMEDLSPAQIGAWLIRWNSVQAVWTPVRVELVHNRNAGVDNNRFDATVVLTAEYVDEGPSKEAT